MYDLALVNGDVYFDNSFHKCNIYIKDGLIKRITPLHLKAEEEYDCLDSLVLPGIIDPHVQVRPIDKDKEGSSSHSTFLSCWRVDHRCSKKNFNSPADINPELGCTKDGGHDGDKETHIGKMLNSNPNKG